MKSQTGNRPRPHLRLVELWIWLAALAGLAGWSLSAIGQLNRAGYLGFFAMVAAIFLVLNRGRKYACPNWKTFSRRFRQPLPTAFAGLATLILAGGILYAPTNYTGLNYHLARVLQWIDHGQWFWIHTENNRMNFSGCAFEWLTTPLVMFTKSDRALFLVNFLPYLLLPGLIFSVFTRLGVRGRVAWHWMWLLPTGYNFLLQSGSIDNDAFAAIFALAAIDFGCRAWESRRIRDFWLSLLAVALLTGTKPTNLPLMLPWAILVLPLLPLVRRHWLATLPVAAWAGLVSFLPIALLNAHYTGDWLGRSALKLNLEIHQPLFGILGNAFQIGLDNLVPPIFPAAGWWNEHAPLWMSDSVAAIMSRNFDRGIFVIGELPTEDRAGLGFGICLLLAVSVLGTLWLGRESRCLPVAKAVPRWLCRGVMVAAWVSLTAYSMKSGMATAARLVTPYYLLMVPLLLICPGQCQVVKRVWWRLLAGGVVLLALVTLVLSPDRPLWPARTILSKVLAQHPAQHSIARALQVYQLYSQRNDALAGVRTLLPPDLKTVGFIGDGDDCDVSLWRPFGSRRVEHFLVSDPPELLRSRVSYVAVGQPSLEFYGMSLDDWLKKSNAELVASTNITTKVAQGPQSWYIARLKP